MMRAGWRTLRRWARPLAPYLSPHRRAIDRIERIRPGQLLQPGATTSLDRYPELFAELARLLAPMAAPRILSWGCSTGEEIVTLRRLMPHARVTGVDINPRSLARARRTLARESEEHVRLVLAGDPRALSGQCFDAVLCLAVLRHGDLAARQPEDCSAILPFDKVDRFMAGLSELIAPGGWLAIANSHFRFADLDASRGFERHYIVDRRIDVREPLYGSDNRRLPPEAGQETIWRKR